MKNITGICLLPCLLMAFGISCSKNSSSTTKPALSLSNSSVKRGEPLIATTNETQSNLFVKWSVNPASAGTWISASGTKSVMLFSNSGNYTITANYYLDSMGSSPYDSSSSPVIVTDSIYNDSSGQWAQCNSLKQVPVNSNDQIALTPVSYSDTGLVLVAHTQQTYGNSYPLLNYSPGPDSTAGYMFVFGEVTEPVCSNSTSVDVPATGIISFSGLNVGTSDVTFAFNGNLYKGTLTVTSSSCTFNWSYTSGVTISPLTIQKQ